MKIIEKKGKRYSAKRYKSTNSSRLSSVVVVIAFAILVLLMGSGNRISDRFNDSVHQDGEFYLEIDDAFEDDTDCYIVGNIYTANSPFSGGIAATGDDEVIVNISRFVYDQLASGNMVLVVKVDGEYQYAGTIYSSKSVFFTTTDFYCLVGLVAILFILAYSIDYKIGTWSHKSDEIVKLTHMVLLGREEHWYAKYSYLNCFLNGDKYRRIRLNDRMFYLEYSTQEDIDGSLNDDSGGDGEGYYTVRFKIREIITTNDWENDDRYDLHGLEDP